MQIKKLSNYNPDKEVEINVKDMVAWNFIRVDRFLQYLRDNRREILEIFITNLEQKYTSVTRTKYKLSDIDIFTETFEKLQIVKNHPNLLDSIINLVLSALEITSDFKWESSVLNVAQITTKRAWLDSHIYFSELLTEMLDREEAINFLRNYFVFNVNEYGNIKQHESLQSGFKSDYESGKRDENTKLVSILLNEGLYATRVDICMLSEALKEYPDSEIKHTVCCSADHAIVKKANENFVLTRTSTLMNGPYCDFCCHDTRIMEKIEHPSKEFYEKLGESEI
ncbi:MAG: hypothetical protein HGN29_07775 [Asgard group archaeon]|nr:hypothetical protein [Asgard group archaeon]